MFSIKVVSVLHEFEIPQDPFSLEGKSLIEYPITQRCFRFGYQPMPKFRYVFL